MGKSKVLVKVNPEGKYVVDVDKSIDIAKCTPNTRVALRNDSYVLHKILPTKVRGTRPMRRPVYGLIALPLALGGSVGEPDEGGEGPRLDVRHDWRSR
ncbi:hypothetical protein ATCC90586_011333 [Pythium insidiosum]|nr:hypothetical protein ATCC90586_011333 [Pythium insidiosum]